jgi:uncharacterized protein (DUF433 family)
MGDVLTREEAIERNPKVCGGQPVFRGTRVPVRTVLASLAAGDTVEQIRQDFPTLSAEPFWSRSNSLGDNAERGSV